ncbi:MAG TPA: Hsp20/alpha crystallin family protein [Polyangiaceae bacterium]|jgi:HSP20 family protein
MPKLEKWTPFRELDLMDRRMRRFFEDLGVVPALTPAADVYETDGELVVELEVPGFDEKELEIEVRDHTLSIIGERTEETEKKEKTLRMHERLEKRFERRFELPAGIDGEHVAAEYTKGVLTVHVPKTSHEQPRKVEITTA